MKKMLSWISSLIVCIVLAILINNFVLFHCQVSGASMDETLKDGQSCISDQFFYKIFGINRFDIVVVEEETTGELIVKRVIGLPNETISYIDDSLYINGKLVEEDFLDNDDKCATCQIKGSGYKDRLCSTQGISLGEDEYFVMGDNRGKSYDSRGFGTISKDEIISKGIVILKEDGKIIWPRFVGW